jgi:7-keto-8-aminopelargonate synthetase-like enzyme
LAAPTELEPVRSGVALRGFDAVVIDEASHYCVSEAAQLSGVPIIPCRHRDPEDLRNCLERTLRPGQRPLVMTDGVFAMTGALAPITDYIQTLQRHSPAGILIDDAHGLGVIGENGRGSLEQAGLWSSEVNAGTPAQAVELYVCGTMSKAMGGFGGIVPGADEFVNRARSSSHYFDGASAPPSAAAGATAKALELILREPQLRRRLQENIRRMRGGLHKLGLEVEIWPTPNIGLQIGNADNMRRIHEGLKARSVLVPYFASYSGTGTDGLLRIAVFATHTEEMIDHLLTEISKLL